MAFFTLTNHSSNVRSIAILWFALGVIGFLPAAFSGMIFDAPGSENRFANVALATSIGTFPLVCICTGVKAIVYGRRGEFGSAYKTLMIPLINIAGGGAAIVWISWFQNGKFNG